MYLAASMSADPLCLHPEMTLLQVRELISGKNFRHFPVRDVLGAYRRLFGIGGAGSSLIEVLDDGRPNLISRTATALEGGGISCTRIVRTGAPGGAGGDRGTVYARVQTYNIHAVHAALRDAGLESVQRKPETPAK